MRASFAQRLVGVSPASRRDAHGARSNDQLTVYETIGRLYACVLLPDTLGERRNRWAILSLS
jgi:hypothetical protein